MQDLQMKTAFVNRNVFFKEIEIVSLKSDYGIGFDEFGKSEEQVFRQITVETEFREQLNDSHTVPSDQAALHESVLQQLKRASESKDMDSEAEGNMPRKLKHSRFNFLII